MRVTTPLTTIAVSAVCVTAAWSGSQRFPSADIEGARLLLSTEDRIVVEGRLDQTIIWAELIEIDPLEDDTRLTRGERAYSVTVLAATTEISVPTGEDGAKREEMYGHFKEKLQGAIARGQIKSTFLVDRRGRWREEVGSGEAVDGSVAANLRPAGHVWAPLPEEGEAMESGKQWDMGSQNGWSYANLTVRCESVRVWPSGALEVVLGAEDLSPGDVVTRSRWVLEGNPPVVSEFTTRSEGVMGGTHHTSEQTLRVLSGGIPVDP